MLSVVQSYQVVGDKGVGGKDEPTSVTEMKWREEREPDRLAIHHCNWLQIVSVSTMSSAVARD